MVYSYSYVYVNVALSCALPDTSLSPGLRLRVVCHSYKLHPHEWSVRGHLYKHITQRVSIYNLQWNRIELMLCEKNYSTTWLIILVVHP